MAEKEKKSIFERLEEEVIQEVGDCVKNKVKKKLFRIGEMSVAFLVGFLLIIVGVVELTAFYLPVLDNGLSYLLFGGMFLLIGLILK